MAGVRSKPLRGGKYQGWFFDANGDRKFFTGTRSKKETERLALRFEDEHRQIRMGYVPAPDASDLNGSRDFQQVLDEYLAWGESQGGRNGRPWGQEHMRKRQAHLIWWQKRLSLDTLADIDNILPRVEKALREIQDKGRAGKTLTNYAEAIGAFCDWCVKRSYLAQDPLKSLGRFDTTPKSQRRALTADEIARLLEACAPHRRLVYETAFMSGLRANELRNLTIHHLDREQSGLLLDAAWTKNREQGFQPIPSSLTDHLYEFAHSGEPIRLYEKFYKGKPRRRTIPNEPLLYVPSETARDLDKDLRAANIPKHTPEGKVDFHACRVAYISFVIESGVTIKEAQVLARHKTPELTMNVYGRVRLERLSGAVERLGQTLSAHEKCVTYVHQDSRGGGDKSITILENNSLRRAENMPKGGFEPPRPVRHHPLKMACLPDSTTSAMNDYGEMKAHRAYDDAGSLSMPF